MTVLSHLFVVSLPNKLYLYESTFEQTKTFPLCRWVVYYYFFSAENHFYGTPYYHDLFFYMAGLGNAFGGYLSR